VYVYKYIYIIYNTIYVKTDLEKLGSNINDMLIGWINKIKKVHINLYPKMLH